MADMILGIDWDITKAEAKQRKLNREFDESQKKADLIGKSVEKLKEDLAAEERTQKEIKAILKDQVKEAAALEEKITKVKSGSATIGEAMELGSLETAQIKLKEMEDSIKSGYKELDKSYSRHDKISNQIDKQNIKLEEQKNKTATIGDNIALSSKKQNIFGAAFKKSNQPLAMFGRRIKELIKSALIFSVITKALNAMKEALGKYLKQDSKLSSSIAKLKGNLATIGATISSSIAPILQWVVDKLVYITSLVGATLARLLGKDVKEMARLANATKKTADEAKKATAGFDTLQKIDTSEKGSSNGIGIDTSTIENVSNGEVDEFIHKLKNAIPYVTLIGIGLAAWKIGNLLTQMGTLGGQIGAILKGIALVAIGVSLVFGASVNWNDELHNGENTMNAIFATIGEVLAAIGLIIAGVTAWPVLIVAALAVAGTWIDNFKDKIDQWLDGLPAGIYDLMSIFITAAYGVWDFIKNLFKGIYEVFTGDWKTGLQRIGFSIANLLVDVLNIIIDALNLVLYPIRAIIAGVGKLAGKDWKIRDVAIPHIKRIPQLATGAILPGGSPMLAWVNDQPKGQPYLEGSIDNIAAAFEKYLGGNPSKQNISINFTGSLAQLARVLAPEISTENTRASVFAKG